ncbi:nicotinamide-nucleotide amidohydrolase family protein [Orrella sp. JC864]|uniref:CinA family protein n=1 Tax=Orrella sp. JC864 TaxID=3120298 RepID=UPI00300A5793
MTQDTPRAGDCLQPVLAYLRRHCLTLVTAESCTGGLTAAALADLAHCGQVLAGGYVCYWPELKQGALGVNPETIRRHGLTSEPVAREMARGALQRSPARIAVANTGLAEPPARGAADVAPGTVCFAWAMKLPNDQVCCSTETRVFQGGRNQVRLAAAHYCLLRLPAWYREQCQQAGAATS